jgi:hypothetical protein
MISTNWLFQEMDGEMPALSPFPFPERGRIAWLNACGKEVLNGKNWPGGQRTSAGQFCAGSLKISKLLAEEQFSLLTNRTSVL